MNPQTTGQLKFREFLSGKTTERVFSWPTGHPSRPTGFCLCHRSHPATLWFYLKSALLLTALKLPFNSPKVALLRWYGARVGRDVLISTDVWIDPTFPQLLTIEDKVMVGVGAKIFLHSFNPDHFKAGRVTLRKGVIVGACSLIGPGVEIGEDAVVAAGAVVGRDVPARKTAIGNPARVVPLSSHNPEEP